jgi:hypothetical protein
MEQLFAPEGTVEAEHPATLAWRILAVLVLALPGASLIFATSQTAAGKDSVFGYVIGGIFIALCALVFLHQSKVRLVLRADGLERWGMRGKLWALRWQDAKELRYHALKVYAGGLLGLLLVRAAPALGTAFNIRLVDVNGKTRHVPRSLKGMDIVAERIIEAHTRTHFPIAKAAIDRGEELRFGKRLVLDRNRVQAGKLFGGLKSCPLEEVEKIGVESGSIKIRQKGKTFAFARLAVGKVPNAFLFVRLCESMLGKRAAKGVAEDREYAGAHVA